MNEYEREFKRDSREKKSVAAQAFRTNRTGRGAVRLPSDYLTKKEREKMNGETVTYSLNAPMTWKMFLAMPEDIQREYINRLRTQFPGITDANEIAPMFGVHATTMCKHFRAALGFQSRMKGARAYHMSDDTRRRWEEFLGAPAEPISEAETSPVQDIVPEPAPEPEQKPKTMADLITIQGGSMELRGQADCLLAYLDKLLKDSRVRLRVEWEAL